ncbi:MAG: hypothetical protein WA970_10810 [Gammaproteobacteria bacterium]
MSRTSGKVHVVRVKKTHVDKRGDRREYSSAYLRRTYREGQRVRNETVANLSALPEHVVDWIDWYTPRAARTMKSLSASVPRQNFVI